MSDKVYYKDTNMLTHFFFVSSILAPASTTRQKLYVLWAVLIAREYNENKTLLFWCCFVTTFGTALFDAGFLNEMCINFGATN